MGVAEGGNQFMVGVGSAVSVAGKAIGVTFEISSAMQDVKNNVVARAHARSNLLMIWRLLRRFASRNDVRNIIYV